MGAIVLAVAQYGTGFLGAWLWCRACLTEPQRPWEIQAVAIGVIWMAQVVGLGLILGYLGTFAPGAFWLGHALLVGVGVALLRQRRRSFWPKGVPAGLREKFRQLSWAERMGLAVLVLVLVGLFLTAMFSLPNQYDSYWYRYSRIGEWLISGSIALGEWQQKPPLFYYPLNAQLWLAWFLLPAENLLRWGNLAQWTSGVLVIFAVAALARQLDFSRPARLLSVLILTGFSILQGHMAYDMTDVITAAPLLAFLALHLRSYRDRGLIPLAWLAFALGLGAKNSAILWGPGLAFLVLAGLLIERPSWAWMWRNVAFGLAALAVLAAPRWVENSLAFGHPIAPREFREKHGSEFSLDRAALNAETYALYFFSYGANPWPLHNATVIAGSYWAATLPQDDPYQQVETSRRDTMLGLVHSRSAAETGAPHLLAVLLMLGGLGRALWCIRRSNAAKWLVVLLLSGWSYLFFHSALLQWFFVNFRYNLLWLPLIAVAAAYCLEPVLRRRGWPLLLVLLFAYVAVYNFDTVLRRDLSAGLSAVNPSWERSLFHESMLYQRFVQRHLGPEQRLAVQQSDTYPYAGFYTDPGDVGEIVRVSADELANYQTAEDFLREAGFDALFTSKKVFREAPGAVHARYADRPGKGWPGHGGTFFWWPEAEQAPLGHVVNISHILFQKRLGRRTGYHFINLRGDLQLRLRNESDGFRYQCRFETVQETLNLSVNPGEEVSFAMEAPASGALTFDLVRIDVTTGQMVPWPDTADRYAPLHFLNLWGPLQFPEDWEREPHRSTRPQ